MTRKLPWLGMAVEIGLLATAFSYAFGQAGPGISITVIPKGAHPGMRFHAPIQIAAGGIESDAHQADVVVRTDPSVAGIPIKVWVENGVGHSAGRDAKLAIGKTVLVANGEPQSLRTDDQGTIAGVLTSSDVFSSPEGGCTIHANEEQVEVVFDGNIARPHSADPSAEAVADGTYTPGASEDKDRDGLCIPEQWIIQPRSFTTPCTMTNTARFRHYRYAFRAAEGDEFLYDPHHWKALDGHPVRLIVAAVQFQSSTNRITTILNTPGNSTNLNEWVEAPESPVITDSNGNARVVVKVKDRSELWAISLVWQDDALFRFSRTNTTANLGTVGDERP